MENIDEKKGLVELRGDIMSLYDETFEIKYTGLKKSLIFRTDISNTELDKTEGMTPQQTLRFFIWKMSKEPVLDPDTIKLMPMRLITHIGNCLMPYVVATKEEIQSGD